MGIPMTYIRATAGSLGTLTSTAGPITDYTIDSDVAFGGIKVTLSKLAQDTIAVDNVHITARSIGNISVSMKAASTATGLDLIGIRNSDFVTTAQGVTKATAGSSGHGFGGPSPVRRAGPRPRASWTPPSTRWWNHRLARFHAQCAGQHQRQDQWPERCQRGSE